MVTGRQARQERREKSWGSLPGKRTHRPSCRPASPGPGTPRTTGRPNLTGDGTGEKPATCPQEPAGCHDHRIRTGAGGVRGARKEGRDRFTAPGSGSAGVEKRRLAFYSDLMDAALRELNDQLDLATQRLLDAARIVPEPDLRAPSLLPGWTRADVLAHLARGADAMRSLLAGARAGQQRPVRAGAREREAAAAQAPKDLMADLAASAMALRTVIRQLPDQAWSFRLKIEPAEPFPAAQMPIRRLVEVELHHCDLGIGYDASSWPSGFTADAVARADALAAPGANELPAAVLPGHPVPPEPARGRARAGPAARHDPPLAERRRPGKRLI